MRSIADRVLGRSPYQHYCLHRSEHRLTVLAYHEITDDETFSRQLDWLTTRFNPISLAQLVENVHGGSSLPPRAVLLTFDDGDPSVLKNAAPLLKQRQVPALAFVVAGLLGSTRPQWWQEARHLVEHGGRTQIATGPASRVVRELKTIPDDKRLEALENLRSTASAEAPPAMNLSESDLVDLEQHGVDIGNHSLTHPMLDQCGSGKLEMEVELSHAILAGALGHAPVAFAYPNGNASDTAVDILKRLGYDLAFLFDHRQERLPIRNPLSISRIRADAHARLQRFELLTSGLHSDLHHLLGRT
jgi:peptidoglycan/xylan/chitin deacetylase (PgdA/CDA1 family)